jgi:hypothetical protein
MSAVELSRFASPDEPELRKRWIHFGLLSALAIVSVLCRIEQPGFIIESLWAEDSYLLINQAHQLGVPSLWQTFDGYLHLYHRLVALLATFMPLSITPIVFAMGWMGALLAIVWVVVDRCPLVGMDRITGSVLVLAISLQPNDGEALLNLGQSFYFLNIALALLLCVPSRSKPSGVYLTSLAVMALSGPACEVMSVVLLIRVLLLQDFSRRRGEYLTVWIFALVQVGFTIESYGVVKPWSRPPVDMHDVISVVSSFLFFGSRSTLVRVSAAAFWTIGTVFLFQRVWGNRGRLRDPAVVAPLLAALTAGAMFMGGALRQGSDMALMNPLDFEARYFVLPYALCFFVALAVTQGQPAARMMTTLLLGLICGATFLTVDRPDRMGSTGMNAHENLQWIAFTRFWKADSSVKIPVNPPWTIWPPLWEVSIPGKQTRSTLSRPIQPLILDLRHVTSSNSQLEVEHDGIRVSSEESPAIIFNLQNRCGADRYVALEIDVWRSQPGWSRTYWSSDGRFEAAKSLGRFYMDGDAIMQFAFRRSPSDTQIKVDLMLGVARSRLQDLADQGPPLFPPLTVPPPTAPGGTARVKAARLFCLGS